MLSCYRGTHRHHKVGIMLRHYGRERSYRKRRCDTPTVPSPIRTITAPKDTPTPCVLLW